jgi:ArsR family transcriptional regulator, arsenate/arsenite/antimonite-responsive transcriptional repressor
MTDCTQDALPWRSEPEQDTELAALCKALGHPHRVRILRFLRAQRSCFVGEIADQMPIAASTLSQHLRTLKDAGLVKGEVSGPRRCYCVDEDALAKALSLLGGL